jgi:Asp-tRNA(Asn)/Glu-tRNA(Gln) amidotransferase C subunit
MAELSNEDIKALGRAVDLEIQEPELTQVGYSLNAILEAMDQIDIPGLNSVEPLPIILPKDGVDK